LISANGFGASNGTNADLGRYPAGPSAKHGAPNVALLLREFANGRALRGGDPYRAKAYIRAAEKLDTVAHAARKRSGSADHAGMSGHRVETWL